MKTKETKVEERGRQSKLSVKRRKRVVKTPEKNLADVKQQKLDTNTNCKLHDPSNIKGAYKVKDDI